MTERESPVSAAYTPGRFVISWAESGSAVETSTELANIRRFQPRALHASVEGKMSAEEVCAFVAMMEMVVFSARKTRPERKAA